MASADDRPPDRDQYSVKDERGNPFVTFSHLVDQQIACAFQTLSEIPSRYAERRRKFEEESREWEAKLPPALRKGLDEDLKEEWRRERPQYANITQASRSDEETAECRRIAQCVLDARAQHRAEDHDDDEEDDFQRVPLRCPYRPAIDNDDDEESERARDPRVRVLPAWLSWAYPHPLFPEDPSRDSQHSSSHNETKSSPPNYTGKWVQACEDLGFRLCPAPSGWSTKDTEEARENPINSSIKQGRIPTDPFPPFSLRDFFEGPATRHPENDAAEEENATTELDLYRRFLGTQNRPAGSSSTSHTSSTHQTFTSTSTTVGDDPDKPSITSTMTTTQRCTLPDGSVYTKVVLKKGFSDGREECTETEHTTHGHGRVRKPDLVQPAMRKGGEEGALGHDGKVKRAWEERKRGGWFWS
ncbi:MAG: hypothetical protein LQ350_001740 [Teloschistes chrysophthalmus]|nr:MAG: hypothetical protein LQ350_001740 [Niorma chrysophthalma]